MNNRAAVAEGVARIEFADLVEPLADRCAELEGLLQRARPYVRDTNPEVLLLGRIDAALAKEANDERDD